MRIPGVVLVVSLVALSACGSANGSSLPARATLPASDPTVATPVQPTPTPTDVAPSTTAAAAADPAPNSTATPSESPVTAAADTAARAGLPDALVTSGGALYALSAATGTIRASWPDAVVAADGASAYRMDTGSGGTDLVRIATRTGVESGRWPVTTRGSWRVAVVSADGRRVVATDGVVDRAHRVHTTQLLVIDTGAAGSPMRLLTEGGTLEPEAIAADGSTVIVLDHRATYYRVRSLSVADDMLYDTNSRDKAAPPEDMHGEAVRAVPSPDGTLLSTLYRLPSSSAGGTPFVHVLDLERQWSYCADLPPGEYDRIATSADGRTLVVGATDGTWLTVDLTDIGTPGDVPLPLTVHRAGTPPVALAVGGSSTTGDLTVTVDRGGVTWHAGTPPTTVAAVPWPAARPAPQLVALVHP